MGEILRSPFFNHQMFLRIVQSHYAFLTDTYGYVVLGTDSCDGVGCSITYVGKAQSRAVKICYEDRGDEIFVMLGRFVQGRSGRVEGTPIDFLSMLQHLLRIEAPGVELPPPSYRVGKWTYPYVEEIVRLTATLLRAHGDAFLNGEMDVVARMEEYTSMMK